MCRHQQLSLSGCVPFQNVLSCILSAISHKTLFPSCFWFVWNYSCFLFIKHTVFLQSPSGQCKMIQKVSPLPLYTVIWCFSSPRKCCWEEFFEHSIPTRQDQCEVVTKISVCMSKPRDFGREAFLTWGRSRNSNSILEWTSGSPLHALLFTLSSSASFRLLWEEVFYWPNGDFLSLQE